ncbi:MAG: LytTR family DNA-binding domain-containing protein [Bacteroidales bacterium]|nr:LytTR family DNA-binding domain-containing protein [Bacteroidales bacterium]
MNTVVRMSKSYWSQVVTILAIPAFFIAFCFIYDPFSIQTEYVFRGKSFAFHILMMTCILLGAMAIMRTIFFFLFRSLTMKWWHYTLWCIFEVFVCSCFIAMYTTLFTGPELPFFSALSKTMWMNYLILIYPYLFIILLQIIQNKNSDLLARDQLPSDSLLKFFDENMKLKLTIDPSAILFIKAESNYVKIHYLELDKVKEFMLRNSMKKIDDYLSAHGLVRCHRSYIVNPRHVKMLSRNKEGVIEAELSSPLLDPIPVSKQYYEHLSSLL